MIADKPYMMPFTRYSYRMKINAVLDKDLLTGGIKHYHKIDFERTPHIMTIGGTGSGKTYLNKLILAKVLLHIPNSQITVLDFKADDYTSMRGCNRLFEFDNCYNGLQQFYENFLARQQGKNLDRSFQLIAVEELGSMLAYYEKKQSDAIKAMLATLILMGRSFNVHCIISTQRPDATYFNSGVRDSISCVIALGNLSREGKSMLFSSFEDSLEPVYGQGVGYMLTNGTNLNKIQVPQISSITKLENTITNALNRQP